jgi:3-dehydrosphinganine reductase
MVDPTFSGKNILISGGSSGIGFAIAKIFVQSGAHITLLARRKALLNSACQDLEVYRKSGDQIIRAFSADVSNYPALEKVYGQIQTSFDVLVNCAGIAYPGEFINLDAKIFEEVININYLGTVNLTKLVLPGMLEKRSGYIVNVASLAALIGIYGYTAYAPSKYAIRGFSRCLRAELKAYGIDVSVVFPPDTDTPQLAFEHSIIPEITRKINSTGSVMSADKVAEAVIKGIRRRQFSIVPGWEGKLLYLFPSLFGHFFYHLAVNESKKSLR